MMNKIARRTPPVFDTSPALAAEHRFFDRHKKPAKHFTIVRNLGYKVGTSTRTN
jgi:hypothetical protein